MRTRIALALICVGIQLTTPWPNDNRVLMAATGDAVLIVAAAALLFSKEPEKGGTP